MKVLLFQRHEEYFRARLLSQHIHDVTEEYGSDLGSARLLSQPIHDVTEECGSDLGSNTTLNQNINAACNNFKDFTESQFISGNQSIEIY
jgi:hypothetical protein